jgi:anti-sigma B factor antagonist
MPAQPHDQHDQAFSRLTITESRSTPALFPTAKPESLVLALLEPLLVHNRERLRHRVLDAIAAGDVHVVVDVARCGYIDASGLGVLVSCSRRLLDAKGSILVAGVNEDLALLFQLTKLDQVLPIETLAQEAA